ncbi:TetR/AcrR family transcriptional regulator [Algiphilus sp.]|uniref:TetR/AcrR family transcriptional regulator n=1 Tax=Algiphilus sp. TaxID=1872431 RepID=UPI003B51F1EA
MPTKQSAQHTEHSGGNKGSTRKRVPRAVREPQMLDAATEVFSERGFHAASMDDIAAKVDVTKPMLYAYFGSKEGLYRAAVQRAGDHVVQMLTELMGMEDARKRLQEGTDALLSFFFSQRAAWTMVYNERMAPEGLFDISVFRERVAEIAAQTLVEACKQASGDGDTSATDADVQQALPYAVAMIGSCQGLLSWWTKHGDVDQARCRTYSHELVESHLRCCMQALQGEASLA